MKLQELKNVCHALKLPIIGCTHRLRWEEYDDADDATHMVWTLATAVTNEADLKDHIFALEQVLKICEAVAKGRYLEDCQRCHWGAIAVSMPVRNRTSTVTALTAGHHIRPSWAGWRICAPFERP